MRRPVDAPWSCCQPHHVGSLVYVSFLLLYGFPYHPHQFDHRQMLGTSMNSSFHIGSPVFSIPTCRSWSCCVSLQIVPSDGASYGPRYGIPHIYGRCGPLESQGSWGVVRMPSPSILGISMLMFIMLVPLDVPYPCCSSQPLGSSCYDSYVCLSVAITI